MLHEIKELERLKINAKDGDPGFVYDFYFDDESWNIKYLVIDTRKWLSWLPGGKYHIISPEWIKEIDWEKSRIYIEYDKETLENSPMYDPEKPVDKKFENKLYDCYRKFVQRKDSFITGFIHNRIHS